MGHCKSLFFLASIIACFGGDVALNVLFVLPCHGGHFSAMSTLIETLSRHHNTTVIGAALCEEKVQYVKSLPGVRFIQENFMVSGFDFTDTYDMLMKLSDETKKINRASFEFLDKFMEKYRADFNILVVDLLMEGLVFAAELHDLPVIIQTPAEPTCVTHAQDVINESLVLSVAGKLIFRPYFNWRDEFRHRVGLPAFPDIWNFRIMEYSCHFPLFIATAPIFYPRQHPSVKHTFVGAPRPGNLYPKITEELQNWMDNDSRNAIYISLGTHTLIGWDRIQSFVAGAKARDYKVIWAVGHGIWEIIGQNKLKTKTTDIFIGLYLSQYAILQHPRVKIFVSHTGLMSTMDAVKTKTPLVCIPQFSDQFFNCDKMVQLGGAIKVELFSFEDINSSVGKIMEDYSQFEAKLETINKAVSHEEDEGRLIDFVSEIASKGRISRKLELGFQFNTPRVIYVYCLMCYFLPVLVAVVLLFTCKKCLFSRRKQKEN